MTSQDYRPRLTFYNRNTRLTPPDVRKNTTLPPRDAFKGQKQALDAYDNYVATVEARQHHYREARKLRDDATASRTGYNRAIREALTAGAPTDNIKDRHDELVAKAIEHEALAGHADTALITLGLTLGQAIHAAAPHLFANAEKEMEKAATRVRADIEALNTSWAEWASAWQLRRILSEMHITGGALSNYDSSNPLPKDVVDALRTIDNRLNDLDTLRSDEEQMKQWRKQQEKAAKYVPEPTPEWQ